MLKILVPTDYSPEAKNALLYAYNFAAYTNSSLILYHAMPFLIPVSEVPFENYYLEEKEEQELLLESAQNLLLQNGLVPTKINMSAFVDMQQSVNEGIKIAFEANECDMIIMGTHGASGFKQLILGSNTSQLIAKTLFPVMAIPPNYKFKSIYHLICASDLENIEDELEVMVPFAKVFQAVLEIFYFDYAFPESEKLMMEAENKISINPYKNIKLSIKKGNLMLNLAKNLKSQINYSNTQLLIMYRGTHSQLENFMLGSNTQKIIINSELPVLVMHKNI